MAQARSLFLSSASTLAWLVGIGCADLGPDLDGKASVGDSRNTLTATEPTVAPNAIADATVYRVGPTQKYGTLQDVVDRLKPGDTVEVTGGVTYPGGVVLRAPGSSDRRITIRGLKVDGRRPVISGGRNVIEVNADHYVLEGLEIANATTRGVFHHAGDVTIRDSVVHDCPNGILGANEGSGSLWLESTEIFRCGQAEKRHAVYMETDETAYPGAVFRMQFCYVHDSLGGNNVKSRAERNEIYYNWIQGGLYHDMELVGPDGQDEPLAREDSDVVGNVIVQEYQDRTHPMIRVGGDGTGQSWGRYRFVNNTIVVGRSTTSAVFRLFDGIESFEAHNNVVYKQGDGPVRLLADGEASWQGGRRTVTGSCNWVPLGSTDVPSEWTKTLVGRNPGFEDLASLGLRPGSASPLREAGDPAPTGPAGHAFPAALAVPQFEPPQHRGVSAGAAVTRSSSGQLDIGAYAQTAEAR